MVETLSDSEKSTHLLFSKQRAASSSVIKKKHFVKMFHTVCFGKIEPNYKTALRLSGNCTCQKKRKSSAVTNEKS